MANYIIDSLNLSSDKHIFTLPYGECSTAVGTAAKTVTVDNFVADLDELEKGATISVKFINGNSASAPTLNINGTGAVSISSPYIVKGGPHNFPPGTVLLLTYDGTNWVRQFAEDTDTDTHYTSKNIVGASATATANAAAENGNVHLNHLEGSTVTSKHKIVGSGATTVTSDSSGNITISSTDNDTTYSAGTGLTLSGTTFNHKNSVTAGSVTGTR